MPSLDAWGLQMWLLFKGARILYWGSCTYQWHQIRAQHLLYHDLPSVLHLWQQLIASWLFLLQRLATSVIASSVPTLQPQVIVLVIVQFCSHPASCRESWKPKSWSKLPGWRSSWAAVTFQPRMTNNLQECVFPDQVAANHLSHGSMLHWYRPGGC